MKDSEKVLTDRARSGPAAVSRLAGGGKLAVCAEVVEEGTKVAHVHGPVKDAEGAHRVHLLEVPPRRDRGR
eukprot:11397092-Alexandrium_andersonii.AAC.1